MHHALTTTHIRGREVEQSSSYSAGGRDEELEEGEDEQEENLGGVAAEDSPIEGMFGAIEENEGATIEEI